MKKIIAVLLFALFALPLGAQTLTPLGDSKCPVSGYSLGCHYALYSGTQPVTTASVNFNPWNPPFDPQKEYQHYADNPAAYVPRFTVSDFGVLNYVPTGVVWSMSGSYVNLDFVDSQGKPAHVVFVYRYSVYGIGHSTWHGYFWFVTSGTQYAQ